MPSADNAERVAQLRELLNAPRRPSAESRRLLRLLKADSPVPVRIRETPLSLSSGGYYMSHGDDPHIGLHPALSSLPEILAHEIGHAHHARDSRVGRLTQSIPSRLAHLLSPSAAILAGSLAGANLDTPLKHAVGPLAGLAFSAPVLYDEHEAWARAKALLEAHDAGKITLSRAAETKLRALVTYWMTPLLSALYGIGASTIMSKSAEDAEDAKYTKPGLRESIKDRVMAGSDGGKPGQWSARKAQLVAQQYKAKGGGYKGGKSEGQKSLSTWTKQKWTTSDGKPAEREGGTTRYLPEKAWDKLSPGERAATNAKKREGSRKGEQFVANTEAAKDARKEAMYKTANTQPTAPTPMGPVSTTRTAPVGVPMPPPPTQGGLPVSRPPPPPKLGSVMMRSFYHHMLGRFPL